MSNLSAYVPRKLSKAERAVKRLSELNKLVFSLREAGRKAGLWVETPEQRKLRLWALREGRARYGKKK